MNKLLYNVLALFISLSCAAQNTSEPDTLVKERKWYVPDAAVLQFAGNMGMFSAGPGYDLAREKMTIDLLFGYVPKFQAEEVGRLITLKTAYKPFKVVLDDEYSVTPIHAGLGISYHFGDQFSTSWDGPIPKGYYWWPTSWRVLGFAGTSVTKSFKQGYVEEINLYGELGTYDLVVTAWYKDDKLRFWDILSASVGIRAKF